jgi:hypothetical protein
MSFGAGRYDARKVRARATRVRTAMEQDKAAALALGPR